VHDPANGGLAAAYKYTLSRAEDTVDEWLLLDQDTLTCEFLAELIDCVQALRTQDIGVMFGLI
jgi:GT2 family glycosyltransferase